jgi:hypothetical protein
MPPRLSRGRLGTDILHLRGEYLPKKIKIIVWITCDVKTSGNYCRVRRRVNRVRRISLGCSVTQSGCGVTQSGCGVTQSGCCVAQWLVRQAAVYRVAPDSITVLHSTLGPHYLLVPRRRSLFPAQEDTQQAKFNPRMNIMLNVGEKYTLNI